MEPQNKAQARNRALYEEEDMWRHYTLFPHDGWVIWEEIASFADGAQALEIGPGMHPHLPIPGTYFVDLSMTALSALRLCALDSGAIAISALRTGFALAAAPARPQSLRYR